MNRFRAAMKILLGVAFMAAGFNHFRAPELYLMIMPPSLPWPMFLQYLAGFFEFVLGLLLFFPKYTRLAAWGLIALLIAVYPANIYMAIHHELFPDLPMWFHWIRLPFQFVLIAWAWWFTRDELPNNKKTKD